MLTHIHSIVFHIECNFLQTKWMPLDVDNKPSYSNSSSAGISLVFQQYQHSESKATSLDTAISPLAD